MIIARHLVRRKKFKTLYILVAFSALLLAAGLLLASN